MGGACSSVSQYIPGVPAIPTPPDVPVDDVRKCAQEILETFTPLYAKMLPVEMVKDELNKLLELKVPKIAYELRSPATPAKTPLKEGWIKIEKATMKGKSWEKMYLVLMNKADNYVACFYEKETQKADMKSAQKVSLDGYLVKLLTSDDDIKLYGEHAILLTSPARNRRKVLLQFENTEEKSQWEGALKFSTKRAKPAVNSDKIMSKAFYKAYDLTRAELGWIGPAAKSAGTEAEHLSALCCEKVDNDIMGKVYDTIQEGKLKEFLQDKCRTIVDKTIGAAVETAWKSAESAVQKAKTQVDSALEKILKPLGELYKTIMAKLGELLNVVLQAAIDKIAKPILDDFATSLVEPTIQCFNACHRTWSDSMAKTCSIENAKEMANYAWTYWLMTSVWRPMWDFARASKAPATAPDYNLWTMNSKLEQLTSDLIINASTTLEDTKDTPEKAWVATAALLLNDCKKGAQQFYEEVLFAVVFEPFQKYVQPLIKEGVGKVQELIPENMQEFLDLQVIVNAFLKKQIRECVQKSAGGKITDALHKIGTK
jgi:hypothetical protein